MVYAWKAFFLLARKGLRYVDNGAGAGITEKNRDGLAEFQARLVQ